MGKKINIAALLIAFCIFSQFAFDPIMLLAAANETLADLTVEEAAKKAISNNTSIKNADDSESLSDENIKKAQDSLTTATTDAALLNAEVNLMSLEMSRSLNLKNIESQKENVEYNILKYFNTIVNAERNAQLYEQSLELQKKNLDISKVKLEVGKLSQSEYDKALVEYENNLATAQTYQNSIDKAYRDLNGYMGVMNLDTKYNLVFYLSYEPIGDVSLTQYTDTFLNNSLTVEQAENNKTTAQFKVDNYTEEYNRETGVISESYNEYDQLVVSFNQASRSLEDTKSSIRQNIQNTYASLKETENTIKTNEAEIETAYKDLDIMKTKLELGKATEIEILQQQYSISQKEENLRQMKNSYVLSAIAFSSPNLLSSMNSGS